MLLINRPLPMFIQLKNLLLLVNLIDGENCDLILPCNIDYNCCQNEVFKLSKRRTGRRRKQIFLRASRIVNQIDACRPAGLKNENLKNMVKFVNECISETNICRWQFACVCNTCRNNRTLF